MRVQQDTNGILRTCIFKGRRLTRPQKGQGPLECSRASERVGSEVLSRHGALFINNFATLTSPLSNLTKDVPWQWGTEQNESFRAVTESLQDSATTAHFDTNKGIEVVVDASPVGLAALLVQEERVVIYASRTLADVEMRYRQTDWEALAIVWACEHFNRYLISTPEFTVITDHKPLETIW